MIYLGIDPGLTQSAFVRTQGYKPIECGIVKNEELVRGIENFNMLEGKMGTMIIEIPICRKWAGSEVSETAIWTGIFIRSWPDWRNVVRINRQKVRMRTVGKKATDSFIRQYLIERFVGDNGWNKNDKDAWFYNFKADIWQAYAVVVVHLDEVMKGGK